MLGAGYADIRKGFDLFLQLWRTSQHQAHFVWLGGMDTNLKDGLRSELDVALKSGNFHLPGHVRNMSDWLSAADVFVLTSREDPYPSVTLEAVGAGLPCITFKDNGGIPDFLETLNSEGSLKHSIVPFGDVNAIAEKRFRTWEQIEKTIISSTQKNCTKNAAQDSFQTLR